MNLFETGSPGWSRIHYVHHTAWNLWLIDSLPLTPAGITGMYYGSVTN